MRRSIPILILISLLLALVACGGEAESYTATFDEAGSWSTGDDTYSEGRVQDGVYDLLIKSDDASRWASAGESFSDGVYQVEATQVDGPLDNGYGMLFRADADQGNFYLFKVSGDGYVWIGRYEEGLEGPPIIGEHWFESTAVRTGINATNTLRVQAEGGNLIFFVNGEEVGRVTDNTFSNGDIGLFGQTLGQGGVRIQFDNFSVTPIATE